MTTPAVAAASPERVLVIKLMMAVIAAADDGRCGCGGVRPRLRASVIGETDQGGRERNCDDRQMLLQKPL